MEIKVYHQSNEVGSNNILKKDDHYLRHKIYNIILKEFNRIKENFLSNQNETFIKKILSFLNESYDGWRNEHLSNNNHKFMPIGILVLGVNTTDHENVFQSLSNTVTNFSSYCQKIVRLKSRNCGSLKKVLEQIIQSIIPANDLVDINLPNSLRYTFKALDKWLKNNDEISLQQIVIIIEDVELFDVDILQNLIEITSARHSEIPFVLLVGVSSTVQYFNTMLNKRCLSLITMQYFHSPNSSDILNSFLVQMMSQGFPFQMTWSLYNYLINEMFLSLDFSISNFLFRYEFCLHEHIFWSPELESLWVKNQEKDKIVSGNNVTMGQLHSSSPAMILSSRTQQLFVLIANWLLKLFTNFPDTKLGTKFHEVLGIHLKYGLANSGHFLTDMELLKSLSPEEVIEVVKTANFDLEIHKENFPVLVDFIECSQRLTNELIVTPLKLFSDNKIPILSRNRKTLNEQLLNLNSERKKKPYLMDFCHWLQNWIIVNLPHHSKFTIDCRAVFINNLDRTKEVINPSIKETLNKGLGNPYAYLKNNRLNLNLSSSINSFMPDMCILYKLHLEHPRFINMYEWLQTFDHIVENKTSNDHPPSLIIQCRFHSAVADLEFLGFVKPSKSKTDHMLRLTYGSIFF